MHINHPAVTKQTTPQGKLPMGERYVSNNHNLTTDELAAQLGLNPQSIRKRYSQTGSYFQLRPVKLPNRRLLWPSNALEQLSNRE